MWDPIEEWVDDDDADRDNADKENEPVDTKYSESSIEFEDSIDHKLSSNDTPAEDELPSGAPTVPDVVTAQT